MLHGIDDGILLLTVHNFVITNHQVTNYWYLSYIHEQGRQSKNFKRIMWLMLLWNKWSDAMDVHFNEIDRKLQPQLEDCGLNFIDYMPAKNHNSFFTYKWGRHTAGYQNLKTKQSVWSRYDKRHKSHQIMPWNICKYMGKTYTRTIQMAKYQDDTKIASICSI